MKPELFKLEGSGNDFLLGIGTWARRLDSEPELVRRLCDRRRGVGADGTLALEAVGGGRVRLGYRNADGSDGDFCGNGTRCASRAAVELLGCRKRLVVETGWADIPAEVDGAQVSLEIPPPESGLQFPEIDGDDTVRGPCLLKIGVPHLVAATHGLRDLDLGKIAPPLRSHPVLDPDGANVDFYSIVDDGTVMVRTWERGVEGETLSCGSGMVAVSLVVMANNVVKRVELVPLSGDRLVVEALGEPPVCATRFTGPAHFVAAVDPSEELLRDL
jgi:diaminopimelate epimerase